MEKISSWLPYISLLVGAWTVVNGILHDAFVLIQHKGGYNRELLRLLMDGHILITCGVMQAIAFKGFQSSEGWAHWVACAATVSLLVYCEMIFPFLKSVVTILLNSFLLIVIIGSWMKN